MPKQEKASLDDAYGNCKQCGHPFDPHLVIVFDVNDFSKGGEIRCPIPNCTCHHTMNFDLTKE
jgi:hypothetical protein